MASDMKITMQVDYLGWYCHFVRIYAEALKLGAPRETLDQLQEALDDYWQYLSDDEKERAPRVPFRTIGEGEAVSS